MEEQIMQYLNRIMRSIGIVLLCFILNTSFGIMWGYAYFEKGWHKGNTLFYLFFVISIVALIWVLYKIWAKPIGFDKH
jgi:ABC-type glycerol-3-phosphate transport system permease component